MSNDLIERLRMRNGFWLNGAHWLMGDFPDDDCVEAADEIERLRSLLAKAREALVPFAMDVGAVSLSRALGHVTRDHLLAAKAALNNE